MSDFTMEKQTKATESGIETLSKPLDHTSELSPEYQELLVKFDNHLKETKVGEEGER